MVSKFLLASVGASHAYGVQICMQAKQIFKIKINESTLTGNQWPQAQTAFLPSLACSSELKAIKVFFS